MLRKANRLTKRGSFGYVYKKGDRVGADCLTMVFVRGNVLRVGFVVSNKLGKAVCRNLIKRRMRAAMRKFIPDCRCAQVVFVARDGIQKLEYEQIAAKMSNLLRRSGIIKQ